MSKNWSKYVFFACKQNLFLHFCILLRWKRRKNTIQPNTGKYIILGSLWDTGYNYILCINYKWSLYVRSEAKRPIVTIVWYLQQCDWSKYDINLIFCGELEIHGTLVGKHCSSESLAHGLAIKHMVTSLIAANLC